MTKYSENSGDIRVFHRLYIIATIETNSFSVAIGFTRILAPRDTRALFTADQ